MENFLDWVIINLPFLCVVVLFIIRAIIATKRGMVKEICSVIATVVASLAVLLIAFAIRKYFVQDKIIFIASLILIVILSVGIFLLRKNVQTAVVEWLRRVMS